LRVATIPHADPYVQAVLPPDAVRAGPAGDPSPWLDPAHVAERSGDIDVLHLHAGHAHQSVTGLECWTETVRRLGVPLVVTVHQVGGPAGPGQAPVDDDMDVVLRNAEVVLTLTTGAADEIAERFGRTAIVVAHPTVVAPDADLGAERGLVGLRLGPDSPVGGSAAGVVRAAFSGAVSGGGRLRVLVGEGWVPDPLVVEAAQRGDLELIVHRGEEWAMHLQQLHVAVLPERCGTHSRDLELCRDVGTRVVAPNCGWFAEQWSDVVTYGNDEAGRPEAMSLTAAVDAALVRPMPRPADRVWRTEQREAVRRVHAEIYARVAGDRRWN
jgi:hypothetical protein